MESSVPSRRVRSGGQKGFTLVEALVVVAIIGIISSVAIPGLKTAMTKARRNAAISDLRVLRDAMIRYAGDNGRYPLGTGEFNPRTLTPIAPSHIKNARQITKNLRGARVDWYIPWNFFDDPLSFDYFVNPQSFCIFATLAYDDSVMFYVTDRSIFLYVNYQLIPIGEN
jgi:prepilin-type N-terminal cleavage/methylation domain-containing protein